MADVSITAANVVPGSNAKVAHAIAGETITAGMAVYKAAATGKIMKADADAATEEARKAIGISLNGASLNQPVSYATSGDITAGGTLTAGIPYYLSGLAAGGICLAADIGTGEYVCQLGLAKSASVLAIDIQYPGVMN